MCGQAGVDKMSSKGRFVVCLFLKKEMLCKQCSKIFIIFCGFVSLGDVLQKGSLVRWLVLCRCHRRMVNPKVGLGRAAVQGSYSSNRRSQTASRLSQTLARPWAKSSSRHTVVR